MLKINNSKKLTVRKLKGESTAIKPEITVLISTAPKIRYVPIKKLALLLSLKLYALFLIKFLFLAIQMLIYKNETCRTLHPK